MSTLVFDIETVGESWNSFDETTQGVLTRWIDKTAKNEEEREAQVEDLRDGLGFSPLTGYVVAIGLYDLERKRGAVFYDDKGRGDVESEHEGYALKPRGEKEMLQDFWEVAKNMTRL